MEVSYNGGTQQPWVFLLKMTILGCFGGTTIYGNTQYGAPQKARTTLWYISGIVLANWVIIMLPIPPIRGTRKLHWSSFRLNVRGNVRVHYLPPTHPKKWGHIKGVLTPIIPYQGLTSGPLLLVDGVKQVLRVLHIYKWPEINGFYLG